MEEKKLKTFTEHRGALFDVFTDAGNVGLVTNADIGAFQNMLLEHKTAVEALQSRVKQLEDLTKKTDGNKRP